MEATNKTNQEGIEMQKLIMPFKKCMMLCGYKSDEYLKHWKYAHVGIDVSAIQGNAGDDHNVYASGNGKILGGGWDNSGGNVIIIHYPDCYNHKTGETYDLIARYMHLESIHRRQGATIKSGDLLGVEGKTKTGDYHLHLEFDTDTDYPFHSPQVSNRDDHKSQAEGNILYKGTDSSVNPSYVLHRGAEQTIVKPTYNPAWLNPEDFTIPRIEEKTPEPEPSIDYKLILDIAMAKLKNASIKSKKMAQDLDDAITELEKEVI